MKLENSKVIVVPWDFSEMSKTAVVRAIEVSSDPRLVRVVHVASNPSAYEYGAIYGDISRESISKESERSFWKEVSGIDQVAKVQFITLFGDPPREVARFADTFKAEMIILPSHGRSGFSRLFLGSVAEQIVRYASCPVLVLKPSSDSKRNTGPNNEKTNNENLDSLQKA